MQKAVDETTKVDTDSANVSKHQCLQPVLVSQTLHKATDEDR